MKILLILTALSLALALCQGACMHSGPKAEIKDGQVVMPTECTDWYDGSKHPDGSKWKTANCLECTCFTGAMQCCTRYSDPVNVPAGKPCVARGNPRTCQIEFYEPDDPSKPCF